MKDIKIEDLYIVGYGLGGGFGGINTFEVISAVDSDDAHREACYRAEEEYQNYEGNYGLLSYDEIFEECVQEGYSMDEIDEVVEDRYQEEMWNWLEVSTAPYSKELEAKVSCYHYYNPYEEITGKVKDD